VLGLGYPDYELREVSAKIRGARGSVPLLSIRYRPTAGTFALEKQTATPAYALEQDFSWSAKGAWVGLFSEAEDKQHLVRAPFWIPKEWDLAIHHRRSPLFLNEGYPLSLDEEFELSLPAKPQSMSLCKTLENKDPPLRWRIEWTRVGDDTLVARFHSELVRGELLQSEIPVFQQQLRSLLAALATEATFSLSYDR